MTMFATMFISIISTQILTVSSNFNKIFLKCAELWVFQFFTFIRYSNLNGNVFERTWYIREFTSDKRQPSKIANQLSHI